MKLRNRLLVGFAALTAGAAAVFITLSERRGDDSAWSPAQSSSGNVDADAGAIGKAARGFGGAQSASGREALIAALFREAARGGGWEGADQAAAWIASRARSLGISADALRNHARRHYREIGAGLAVGVCQLAGPPDEADSLDIVSSIAGTDLREAVGLSKEFGSGVRFSQALARILDKIDPTAADVQEKLRLVVAGYDDATDLGLLTDSIETWILARGRELGRSRLLEFCTDGTWGTVVAEAAWRALWDAREATTIKDAADFLGTSPAGPPAAAINRMCCDLVEARTPASSLVEWISGQERDAPVAASAAHAMLSSPAYLQANMKEAAAFLDSGNAGVNAFDIAVLVRDVPAGLRDEFIPLLRTDLRDSVLEKMVVMYQQRGNRAEVDKWVSRIADPETRNRLLESTHETAR